MRLNRWEPRSIFLGEVTESHSRTVFDIDKEKELVEAETAVLEQIKTSKLMNTIERYNGHMQLVKSFGNVSGTIRQQWCREY